MGRDIILRDVTGQELLLAKEGDMDALSHKLANLQAENQVTFLPPTAHPRRNDVGRRLRNVTGG
eukprot:2986672-Rhodomonas_salina.2